MNEKRDIYFKQKMLRKCSLRKFWKESEIKQFECSLLALILFEKNGNTKMRVRKTDCLGLKTRVLGFSSGICGNALCLIIFILNPGTYVLNWLVRTDLQLWPIFRTFFF